MPSKYAFELPTCAEVTITTPTMNARARPRGQYFRTGITGISLFFNSRLAYRRTRLIQPPHQRPVRADAKAINAAHASVLACIVVPQNSYCHGPGAEL